MRDPLARAYHKKAELAEKAGRFGEAARHWNDAAHAVSDGDKAQAYIKRRVRSDMKHTRRLLELNGK